MPTFYINVHIMLRSAYCQSNDTHTGRNRNLLQEIIPHETCQLTNYIVTSKSSCFFASFISLVSRLFKDSKMFLLFMLFHLTFCIYTQYTWQNQKVEILNRCRLSSHVHCSIFFNPVTSPYNIFLLDPVNITCSCFSSGLKGLLNCLCLSMPTALQ